MPSYFEHPRDVFEKHLTPLYTSLVTLFTSVPLYHDDEQV